MFVDIESFKGAIGVENILMPYKKGRLSPDKKTRLPKEHITPDVCWQILKSTNNPVNIQHMLECIAELPASEQAHFKEVVLATFSNREQPNKQPYNIVLLGKKLAAASGYEAELADAQKLNEGVFLLSAPKLDKVFVCLGNSFSDVDFSAYDKVIFFNSEKIEFGENVKFPRNVEFPNSLDVSFLFYNKDNDLCGCDLSEIQSIFFKDGAKVDLTCAKNLPPQLDVSTCSDVNLSRCNLLKMVNLRFKEGAKVNLSSIKTLSQNLDVSMCSEVNFSRCNLLRMVNLRFKEGAKVDFSLATSLPPNLDVSMCADVNLSKCKLLGTGKLLFHEGAKVDFSSAKCLPAHLDVSMCADVNLSNCDLYQLSNLRFKDGAIVNLGAARNLPPNLDVANCSEVKLFWCNLSGIANLAFKDGAKVDLSYAHNLPENLDFSMCSEVDLEGCDLSGLKMLVFKNRQQMHNSAAKLPENWKGTLVFTDEQKQSDLNLTKEALARANLGR